VLSAANVDRAFRQGHCVHGAHAHGAQARDRR